MRVTFPLPDDLASPTSRALEDVTNPTTPRAEQWLTEGRQAVRMTRLSCYRFRPNKVGLWLSILPYNRGTFGAD
jgi:hypothetical protein